MNDDHIKKYSKNLKHGSVFSDEFENVRVDFDIFRYMEPIFHIDNNFQFSEQRIIEKSGMSKKGYSYEENQFRDRDNFYKFVIIPKMSRNI